ncbi:MAG: class I SAM-dependent methyltransferase [Candidatus Ornithospirochaeta sp.]|nr:class I SAM-dependent methyltransferase [Candidatus Ornithospirochaeta sp.]
MDNALGFWISDNAELFRYIGELPALRNRAGRILLSGGVSAFLSPVFRTLYPESTIVAVDGRRDILDSAAKEDPLLETVCAPFESYCEPSYDIAVSALSLQSLDTRELTGYLFNLYDSIVKGGLLFISFPDSLYPNPSPKTLVQSWYSMDEEVYMKRFMAGDVAKALSMIGFSMKSIEADSNPELEHVVSMILERI